MGTFPMPMLQFVLLMKAYSKVTNDERIPKRPHNNNRWQDMIHISMTSAGCVILSSLLCQRNSVPVLCMVRVLDYPGLAILLSERCR